MTRLMASIPRSTNARSISVRRSYARKRFPVKRRRSVVVRAALLSSALVLLVACSEDPKIEIPLTTPQATATPLPSATVVTWPVSPPVAESPTLAPIDTPPPPPPTPLPTPTLATAPPPSAVPPTVPPPPAGNCDPSYPDVCIPPPPPDLSCGDVPYEDIRVLPPDPHGFDRDNDGVGCEG